MYQVLNPKVTIVTQSLTLSTWPNNLNLELQLVFQHVRDVFVCYLCFYIHGELGVVAKKSLLMLLHNKAALVVTTSHVLSTIAHTYRVQTWNKSLILD